MASSKNVEIKSPRKLIEVALPLDKINAACAHEKMPGIGAHPRGIHLWWARRPLAAARAFLFAQLVNDPGYERSLNRGVNKIEAARERERLFRIIEDLVLWENTNNEPVLSAARAEIWNSWRETCELNRNHPEAATLFNPETMPAFHDPFAGGGAIPVEAQRLGLEAGASDLNPVAVTINKSMIEIPSEFVGQVPIGELPTGEQDNLSKRDWPGSTGLAEDVRRYGFWMRREAEKRVGHLYPKVEVTADMAGEHPDLTQLVGQRLTVIAYLWARTVKSPNPAYSHIEVPLISTFILSSKPGKQTYLEPKIEDGKYRFMVRSGNPPVDAVNGTKLPGRANFRCIMSDAPIETGYIKQEGIGGRISSKLLAVVVDGPRGRVYLPASETQEALAKEAKCEWFPHTPLPNDARAFTPILYGFNEFGKLFTTRQLTTLDTLSSLVADAIKKCRHDAVQSGLFIGPTTDVQDPHVANSYAQAVGTY